MLQNKVQRAGEKPEYFFKVIQKKSLCPYSEQITVKTLLISTEYYTYTINRFHLVTNTRDFPGDSDGEESACNAGDLGLIPGLGRSPGEEMATHSNILAWRIPWTEEPGWLQFMGSQRIGHS